MVGIRSVITPFKNTHLLTFLNESEVWFLQHGERDTHPPLLLVNLYDLNREKQCEVGLAKRVKVLKTV